MRYKIFLEPLNFGHIRHASLISISSSPHLVNIKGNLDSDDDKKILILLEVAIDSIKKKFTKILLNFLGLKILAIGSKKTSLLLHFYKKIDYKEFYS